MMIRPLIMSTLVATLFLSTGLVSAADQQQIYGSQLMTQQEMFEFRQRMRNAKSPQAREQIRNEHHQQMHIRAKAQGVTLPDKPPAKGAGGGKGMGSGGKGSGGNRKQ